MATSHDDDLTLVEEGRERETTKMRTRVYWALVSMALFSAAPGLLFASSHAAVWGILGALALVLVVSFLIAEHLMMPVYVLKRRLEVKNYGGEAQEAEFEPEVSLESGGFEFAALLAAITNDRNVNVEMVLPVELADVERLARAGRVTELAMETVRRDLFRHLSHQLKSPLALIRAHAQTIGKSVETHADEAVFDSLKSIEAMSLNMSGLVEQMLSMAWVEGLEEQGVNTHKANLSKAVTELVGFRERVAQDKQMRIEQYVEAGLWVKGMQQLLQEMVACLVDNALRYGPSGSVVTVEARRLPGARAIVVTVTDRGPGIPVHERERVFEPFYGSIGLDANGNMTYGTRRHRALGAGVDKSSHGLGLALVRAVAKLHGATVKLDSGPGGIGLCVRIVLSATPPPELDDEQ